LGLIFLLYSSDQPKKHNILEDLPTNIYTKLDSNSTIGFRKEDVKQTTPCWHNGPLVSLVYFQSTKNKLFIQYTFLSSLVPIGTLASEKKIKIIQHPFGHFGPLVSFVYFQWTFQSSLVPIGDVVMETTKYRYTELKWSTNV
jgi:hypothetical protein